jgi:hypothetical protein
MSPIKQADFVDLSENSLTFPVVGNSPSRGKKSGVVVGR